MQTFCPLQAKIITMQIRRHQAKILEMTKYLPDEDDSETDKLSVI